MLLSLPDYIDRVVDPTSPFVPISVHDDLLAGAAVNPGLAIPATLVPELTRARSTSALRLQQHLVYRIGAQLGVLQSAIADVRSALSALPALEGLTAALLETEAAATAIGVASDALSSIPLVGFVVKIAALGAETIFSWLEAGESPGLYVGPQLADAQQYKTDADASLANDRLLTQADSRDWTSLFQPSMRGELAAWIQRDPAGRIVIAWGLRDDGKVPRIIIDKKPSPLPNKVRPWEWHFSEEGGGPFSGSDGLGAVPGSGRIVQTVQCAIVEPSQIHAGHASLGDPRCGSSKKTLDVDTGTWLPSTASGAASLFGYCTKASASSYTIATQEVVNAWQSTMDAIWDGIERLWRNEDWEGGWGCGPWQNALAALAAAHCVGSDGQPGGFGAWMPTRYQTKLTAADRNAWEKNNLATRIVKPAMMDLREMQLALLRKTPMAAYLPSHGLGAMRDVSVKEAFDEARVRILKQPLRNQKLRRVDVVDDWYREQLVARSIGSDTADGGISSSDYKPPRMSMPGGGGGGRGAAVLIGGAIALAGIGLAIRARRR